MVGDLTREEYQERLKAGWRRFGFTMFRPACPACKKCQSVRVPVATFKPDRSQRRAAAANDGEVRLVIGTPAVTRAKLDLYDRFHRFQHDHRDWPEHDPRDASGYVETFVDNPFPSREWCYYLGEKLVGVGY